MKEKVTFSFRYLPLLIRLRCDETAQLPGYLGSTLHGILGWALTSHKQVYRYLFDNRLLGGARRDVVNPYIIEPPRYRPIYKRDDVLCFRLILLGDAADYAKDVIEAIVRTRQFGIGAGRKSFTLIDILQAESYRPIWQSDQADMEAARSVELAAYSQEGASRCSIHLLTPLRIRRGGALVLDVDFPTIMRNITRRISALTERYGGYVDSEAISSVCHLSEQIQLTSSGLYLNTLNRFSSRRNETMDVSGLLGAMTFEGEMTPFSPWLNAARILHIGRNTTFGFGRIDVVFGQ